jgi:hypothetical protein
MAWRRLPLMMGTFFTPFLMAFRAYSIFGIIPPLMLPSDDHAADGGRIDGRDQLIVGIHHTVHIG